MFLTLGREGEKVEPFLHISYPQKSCYSLKEQKKQEAVSLLQFTVTFALFDQPNDKLSEDFNVFSSKPFWDECDSVAGTIFHCLALFRWTALLFKVCAATKAKTADFRDLFLFFLLIHQFIRHKPASCYRC